ELSTQDCNVPDDERTRMQRSLEPLGRAVEDFPRTDLWLKVLRHPGNASPYHVEAKLRLPGQTFFSGDWDPYLDTAFQRCVRKLVQKVSDYKQRPDRKADESNGRRAALGRNVVAPEAPDAGPLGRAVGAGASRAFRNALAGYE